MSVVWDHIIIGMKVEVENKDSEVNQYPGVYSKSYWIASILRISGYYVLLRYEGFGQDGSKDFWMNITSEKVHPVGWCITKGKPLIPPKCEITVYLDSVFPLSAWLLVGLGYLVSGNKPSGSCGLIMS